MFNEEDLFKESEKTSKGKGCLIGLLIFFLAIGICGFTGYKYFYKPVEEALKPHVELISNSISPDGKYKIQSYVINGGATVDWIVEAYLMEENAEKKLIYKGYHVKQAEVKWLSNDKVIINKQNIDIPDGSYIADGYSE